LWREWLGADDPPWSLQASVLKEELDGGLEEAKRSVEPVPTVLQGYTPGWHKQFWVLCRRSWRNTRRNPLSSYVILGRTVVMSLLVGSLYWQLGLTTEDMGNRTGALFFCLVNQVFSSLGQLSLLLDERDIVANEARSAEYPVGAYFLAKQMAEVPLGLATSALFAAVTFLMIGLQNFGPYLVRGGGNARWGLGITAVAF
jgi:hypothetical protein